MNLGFAIAAVFALAGLAFVAAGVARARHAPATDAASYLQDLEHGFDDDADADEFSKRMRQSFLARALRPLGSGCAGLVGRLTPRHHVLRVHHQLLLAGMSAQVRAEEFVTAEVLGTGFGLLLGVAMATLTHQSSGRKLLFLVLLPVLGVLMPETWLSRKVRERKEAILKDLPDVLDLLAISVEAGVGFEGRDGRGVHALRRPRWPSSSPVR